MRQITLFLSTLIVLTSLFSCTISKRQYQPGFYFRWNHSVTSAVKMIETPFIDYNTTPKTDTTRIETACKNQELQINTLTDELQDIDNSHSSLLQLASVDSIPETQLEKEMKIEASELAKMNDHNRKHILPISLGMAALSILLFAIVGESLWGGALSGISSVITCILSVAGLIFSIRIFTGILKFRHRRRKFLKKYKSLKSNSQYRGIRKSGFNTLLASFFILIALFFFFTFTIIFIAIGLN